MPPKTREEVRHTLLVSMFLDKMEEEYENTGDVPSNWWSDDEARYLMRNYSQHNFTKDERDFASSEAITKFELTYQPQLFFVPYIVGDIVEDVLDLVIGREILWDDPSTWPESWHRGNRLADLD